MPLHSAVARLHEYGRRYPHAWESYAQLLDAMPHDWPSWCWCPLAGAYAVVSGGSSASLTAEQAMDIGPLGALAAWRSTQGIYRVHPSLLAALLDTPIAGDLPSSLLERLPEWSVYVETPGHMIWDLPLRGYWGYLESDSKDGRVELRLVLDIDGAARLGQMILHLGGSLIDGMRAAVREARIQALRSGQAERAPSLAGLDDERALAPVAGLVSVLLYLCADEREVSDLGELPPRVVRGKKRPLLPTPKAPQVHECGYRMGAQLDAATRLHGEALSGTGPAVTPHVRRAHWHGYWRGPRDGERRLSLRWLSPMLVGGAPETAIVRPVGGKSDGPSQ